MIFELQHIGPDGPTDFLEAHRLAHLSLSFDARFALRDVRWIAREHDAVLYVASESHRREGPHIRFVLVIGAALVEFNAGYRRERESALTISTVTLPESWNGERAKLAGLLVDAVEALRQLRQDDWIVNWVEHATDIERVFIGTTWIVVAQPGSARWRRERDAAASARRRETWRTLRYRVTGFPGRVVDWWTGRSAWIRPVLALNALTAKLNDKRPVDPYPQLRLAIRMVDANLPEYDIVFENRGWRGVTVLLSQSSLLELVAPGFAALSEAERYRHLGLWHLNELVANPGALRIGARRSRVLRSRGFHGFVPPSGAIELTLAGVNRGRLFDKWRVQCRYPA